VSKGLSSAGAVSCCCTATAPLLCPLPPLAAHSLCPCPDTPHTHYVWMQEASEYLEPSSRRLTHTLRLDAGGVRVPGAPAQEADASHAHCAWMQGASEYPEPQLKKLMPHTHTAFRCRGRQSTWSPSSRS